jgi:riboflavin kinase/FMN adenylyltransferase
MTVSKSMSSNFRVFRSLEEVPSGFGPCALTIGNFDGVHAGHRQILRRVVQIAHANGWKAAALTLDPHPLQVVAPDRAPKLMSTPLERCEFLREEGIEEVLILPFNESVARIPPDVFVRDIVVGKLQARAILVGKDFRFGHKHAGNTELLAKLGQQLDFATELVSAVTLRGKRVSSSLIRGLVETGNVSRACRFLSRPFHIDGPVVSGQGIGSKQTVPTLNLAPPPGLIPKTGVYVTRTRDLDNPQVWNSITNVGFRPTFDGASLTIETFLLDPLFTAPSNIRVQFLLRLRDERKFDTPEALKAQILRDVNRTRNYFRRVQK